jgi:hypothetical protein
MAYRIPTLAELHAAHLARLEGQIGQESPLNDKAFLDVLAAAEAGLDIGHYKYAADAALQNIALTAIDEGLDRIGNDNSTPRKQAVSAVLVATLPATTGTVIPAGWEFVSDSSGKRYRTEAAVTSLASVATLSLRCTEAGSDGNLDDGETLSISAPVAGATTEATVTDTTTTGADQESDSDYRPRVIFAQRAITGGGNGTDHKIWAEAVAGVRRAFPYAARPSSYATSYPGDRTIYIECTSDIDADGVAPLSLLDDVRDAVNIDPDTGKSRAMLGLTDATLYILAIQRIPFFVQVGDLFVAAEKEAQCKIDIAIALDLYFKAIAPYIDGVDNPLERSDSITNPSVGEIVQDVVKSYGGNIQSVAFGLAIGSWITFYFLNPGELGKLGSVSYV